LKEYYCKSHTVKQWILLGYIPCTVGFNYRNSVVMEHKLAALLFAKLSLSSFSVVVSRITTNAALKRRTKQNYHKEKVANDGYSVCIKAKAICASSGPTAAMSFGLKRLRAQNAASRAVLLNTLLSGCLKKSDFASFWKLFETRVLNDASNWSPELAATALNAITLETEQQSDLGKRPELLCKGVKLYAQALEMMTSKNAQLLHFHNSFLKLLSRHSNTSMLLWYLQILAPKIFSESWVSSLVKLSGLNPYVPVSTDLLKVEQLFRAHESLQLNSFDCISLTSMLGNIARCSGGTVKIAEAIWGLVKLVERPDKSCWLALLLVYRNDLSRMLGAKKLIRSTSWRMRYLGKVHEHLASADPNWHADVKLVSIYYEICLNARLSEYIVDHVSKHNSGQHFDDERVRFCIKKALTIKEGLQRRTLACNNA